MNNKEYFPISVAQQGTIMPTLFLPKVAAEQAELSVYFTVKSDPNIDALKKAFNLLIERNNALRSKIVFTAKGLREYVEDYFEHDVPVIHLNSESELMDAMSKNRSLGHSFINNELYKAIIYTYGNSATLQITCHHIVIDGFSLGLLTVYLKNYYEESLGLCDSPSHKPYDIQDYYRREYEKKRKGIIKQNSKCVARKITKAKGYRLIAPPLKCKAPASAKHLTICNDDYQKLCDYAKTAVMPTSFLFSTLLALVIYYDTHKKSFVFCHNTHGRSTFAQKTAIGCFVNTALSLYSFNDDETIASYIHKCYVEYLGSLKQSDATIMGIIFRMLPKELSTFSFVHWGFIYTALNIRDVDIDKTKYSFGSVPWAHQANPIYCLFEDNYVDKAEFGITYQGDAVTDEKYELLSKNIMSLIRNIETISQLTIGELENSGIITKK